MDKQRKRYLKYIGHIIDDLLLRTKTKNYKLGKLHRFPWCDIASQHCELDGDYVKLLYEDLDPDDVFPRQVEKWVNETYGIKGGEYPLIMDIYLTHLTDG